MNLLRSKWTIGLLGLAATLLYYNLFIRMNLHQFLDARLKLRKIERDLQSAQGDIQILRRTNSTQESVALQAREAVNRTVSEILPEFLTRIGSIPGIQYNRVQPKDVVTERKLMKLPFALEGSGGYDDILTLLQTLKEMPLPTEIERLTITQVKTADDLNFFAAGALFFLPKASAIVPTRADTTGIPRNPFLTEEKKIVIPSSGATREASPPPPEPRLQGIIMGGAPYAIINGSVVQIGSKVNGYEVTDIDPTRVFLKKRGRSLTLTLEGSEKIQ